MTGPEKRPNIGTGIDIKKISAVFYTNEAGNEPVRQWLKKLGQPDSRTIGTDIRTVEFGWPLGMPVCRPLGDGLYEVRSSLEDGRIARVIFCIIDANMYLLHGFIKKRPKISPQDLDLAKQRKRKLEY